VDYQSGSKQPHSKGCRRFKWPIAFSFKMNALIKTQALSQLSIIAIALCVTGCKESAASSQQPPPSPNAVHSQQAQQAGPTPSASAQPKEILMNLLFTREKSLSYNGFNIAKLAKRSKGESQALSYAQKLSYAVVTKDGKVLAQFDGSTIEPENATDFGLFPLLGSKTKQLIISQTRPRTGRHWIVELAANPKVIFDSGDYEVGREEVWAVDIEGDGVYEIGLFVTRFYGAFDQLSVMNTPLPTVIFSYDKQTGRYLPANHRYRDYLLKDIETEIRDLPTEGGERYLATRLDILLRFLYAGKEKEGWEFFDKAYALPDADKIKAKVKEVLQKAPAYNFIRKKSSI
jgi:hypothetical protein